MADNYTTDVGTSGKTYRSDQNGGVDTPVVKMELGVDGTFGGFVGATNPMPAAAYSRTTGGATIERLISAGSVNSTSVKGSAGTLLGAFVTNSNSAVRYLKIYNKATAPTVGSDTPVLTLAIPGNTDTSGFNLHLPTMGLAFGTGIGMALTTGIADNDTGAVAANEIVVSLFYA